MDKKKMTRIECEREIAKHLEGIFYLYREYNPNGQYLSLYISNGHHLSVNNSYFSDDAEHPIDFFMDIGDEDIFSFEHNEKGNNNEN